MSLFGFLGVTRTHPPEVRFSSDAGVSSVCLWLHLTFSFTLGGRRRSVKPSLPRTTCLLSSLLHLNVHFMVSTRLISANCSLPFLSFSLNLCPFLFRLFLLLLHLLVLTSLSMSALRVLCTSSPSRSISAFRRSF